jgi:hypothetical protein
MLVEISEGKIAISDFSEEMSDDLIRGVVGAGRLETVPVPPHPFPGVEVIAYCSADARGLRPNCTVEGYEGAIYGPLVIVGLEGESHRELTLDEAAVYVLEDRGADFLPVLRLDPAYRSRA